jgi:SAM-dependent methyltransferase
VIRPADPAALARIRQALVDADYTEEEVRDALEVSGRALAPEDIPVLVRKLASAEPLHTLLRLFRLGQGVAVNEVAKAMPLDDAVAAGLVTVDGDVARSPFGLDVFEELYLLRDRAASADHVRPDHVLGVSPSTQALAALAIRRPMQRALDLGTGCGAVALALARDAAHVVATDVSERALGIASFNAALNDAGNVSFVRSSSLDGVGEHAFDLVVCNPPFVVSPESGHVYRDAAGLAQDVLARVPGHVAEGGFAVVLAHWGITAGEDWWATPSRWVEGGCDAMVLGFSIEDPRDYAAMWNRGTASFEQALDRWLAYYRENDIRAIGRGAVVLRRRSAGPYWLRFVSLPRAPTEPCGEQVLRMFHGEDVLFDEEGLLDRVLVPSADHVVQQVIAYDGGGYVLREMRAGQLRGLRLQTPLDPGTVQLLTLCDGTRPLRDVAGQVTAPADDLVASVRRLLELGFLEVPL